MVDGDLCEQYYTLDAAKKKMIAQELDRTPGTAEHVRYDHGNSCDQCSRGGQEAGGPAQPLCLLTHIHATHIMLCVATTRTSKQSIFASSYYDLKRGE